MGITGAIAAVSALTGVYNAVSANQRNQDAKGVAGEALRNAPNPLVDAARENAAGMNAANRQKKAAAAAGGFTQTILTGPKGLQAGVSSGASRSTLLGG